MNVESRKGSSRILELQCFGGGAGSRCVGVRMTLDNEGAASLVLMEGVRFRGCVGTREVMSRVNRCSLSLGE